MPLKIGRGAKAPPFIVMDVITQANARQAALPPGAAPVIRMEVGQPGTGAPAGAVAAAAAALQAGAPLGYTEALGLASLRARIALHYARWYGAGVPAARVAVTVGASGAFPLAFLAAFDPGDRVAMAAPFYPPYVNVLAALGIEPVILEAGPDTRFQPTVDMLDRLSPRPDGLVVASPGNPAGTMLHPAELAGIAGWCHANGVRLISDEIYHGLHYDLPVATAAALSPGAAVVNSFSGGRPRHNRMAGIATAANLSPSAIVISSFSKYWCMTGWRIGWMVLPDDLVRPVESLAQNMFISPPHIAQVAAEAAMDCTEALEANIARYARSRDMLLKALPEAGFPRLAPPEGAFYLWADVSDRTNDSRAFCARMLAEAGVASSPGVDFDRTRGNRFIRFSYCGPEADMREAAERLKRWR